MPSWCAWRSRRCCWAPGRNITGCGCATPGGGPCSPACRTSPAITNGSRPPLLAAAMDYLAREVPSWHDQMRLIDATPVPCGTSRETAKRSGLAGWASYGYCAAHSRWYWGLKLYLITTPDGMPTAWCLASPQLGEREVAADLLAHARRPLALPAPARRAHALRPGLTIISDKGLAGQEFEDLVTSGYGLHLVRPDRRDETPRHGSIGWIRPGVESGKHTPKSPAR